ncbi:NUDIX domain-containing protein [Kiloniella antarctica]|uniref:ADP-ribose pyrophosphatase n=1 Tax=Kiloniella antarctica TaxID=1550907 RepID=A0ABW5BNG9_9PROT
MRKNQNVIGDLNNLGKIEVIEKSTPFKGYFQVDTYRFRHSLFEGGLSQEITREIFERGHAAAVLLFDAKTDEVILIEQFRPGAYAAGMAPWLIEVVAGIIEPDENAEDLAQREAMEESGCKIGRLEKIGTFLMTPGGSSETIALFCGEILSQEIKDTYGLDHEGEDIRTHRIKASESYKLMNTGKVTNAITAIALQWLELNNERIRTKWLSD